MKTEIVEVDVRGPLAEGRSPLPLILNTVGSLKPQQSLRLFAPWEPTPLYEVLGHFGFSRHTRHQDDNLWIIDFQKDPVRKKVHQGEPPCII